MYSKLLKLSFSAGHISFNRSYSENRSKPKEELLVHHTTLSFKTIRGLEQKKNKMCVLDMDQKGDLYLYKFALLCKNEIIKRLINGSYHGAEPSNGAGTIGNSLIKLFSWHECDLQYTQLTLEMIVSYSLLNKIKKLLSYDEIPHKVIIFRSFR